MNSWRLFESNAIATADMVASSGFFSRASNAVSQGGCTVVHDIEDRVYAEYFVRKAELPDVERINAEMTSLIRGFMVPRRSA